LAPSEFVATGDMALKLCKFVNVVCEFACAAASKKMARMIVDSRIRDFKISLSGVSDKVADSNLV
jgi:hypothetical protein